MKIVGIVAEYNPFHQGHAWQLARLKEMYHPDLVVVITTGFFSSRGLPSLLTPAQKAKKALEAGADLVLALPDAYGMQAADRFALHALQGLQKAGVNTLCFGSESGDLSHLLSLAKQVEDIEPDPANSMARNTAGNLEALRPNDILAIQYIRHGLPMGMDFLPLPRQQSLKSATAIRADYFAGKPQPEYDDGAFHKGQSWERYYPFLRYMLQITPAQKLKDYFLVEEGIENRLKQASEADSWDEFLQRAISKTYTKARIQRTCMMILQQIEKEEMKNHPEFSELIVLGMNEAGRNHLKTLDASIRPITRFRDMSDWLQKLDLNSRRLYALADGSMPDTRPVILSKKEKPSKPEDGKESVKNEI